MKLINCKYSEFEDNSHSWEMERIEFENVNLIVGKNAAGKSRVLNVIEALSGVILNTNNLLFLSGNFDANFVNGEDSYHLEINLKDRKVSKEKLEINGETKLERNSDGTGFIYSNVLQQNTKFEIPNEELFIKRRDKLQHPFLQELHDWANSLVKFRFTGEASKQSLLIIESTAPPQPIDKKNTSLVALTFHEGFKKHGQPFKQKIIDKFSQVGFPITDIVVQEMNSITHFIQSGRVVGLHVQETDRMGTTDQNSMSDGMFRALGIIIHFIYYEFEHNAGCILIDDVGEGLDFERSVNLIKILIAIAESSGVQLIMCSNDRMIMNNTKLDYWHIISRTGNKVKFYNKKNSADIFSDFKFTGLNNFDFFTTGFYKSGFSETENN